MKAAKIIKFKKAKRGVRTVIIVDLDEARLYALGEKIERKISETLREK